MTRRLAATALTTLLAACGGQGDPNPKILYFPPEELTLPAGGWRDEDTEWSTVSVLNATWFPFQLEEVQLSGVGASYLEIDAPGGADGATLGVRESLPIKVRIRPPTFEERGRWSTGSFEADLRFSTRGYGAVDIETGVPDPTKIRVDPYEVKIKFKLSCDLDGDGVDAEACSGGLDCDDELAVIVPGADEACDGIDNDCSGQIDEGCD